MLRLVRLCIPRSKKMVRKEREIPELSQRSSAPFISVLTGCMPDGPVLEKVTDHTIDASIKGECDPLGTCANAMHLQEPLVILCIVGGSDLRTLGHT